MLRKEKDIVLTDEHHKCIETLRKDLEQACQLALKLPKANAQYVILPDASFYAGGYVLLIANYATDQSGKQYKTYDPVSFGSKIFTPTYLKLSIYAKDFLAVHFAFDNFSHIFWGRTKLVLVLTDNNSLTRFFQAKTLPSCLWKGVDTVLTFNFVLGHIPGKANAAADYLPRIHIQPHTKLEPKFNSKIPVADNHLNMRMQIRDNSVILLRYDCELFSLSKDLRKSYPEITALHASNPLYFLNMSDEINPVNRQAEQQKGSNIQLVLARIGPGPPSQSHYTNHELRNYLKHFNRLENHNGVLYRKVYSDNDRDLIRQYVVPTHLR